MRLLLESGVHLEVCCINDPQVWERVYARGGNDLNSDTDSLRLSFARHSKSKNTHDGGSLPLGGGFDSSDYSSSDKSHSSKSLSRNSSIIETEAPEEQKSFEEQHSLTAVLKYCLETKDDPHGADGLLDLIAKLREEKEHLQGAQHQVEASPSRKKKPRRSNRRNRRNKNVKERRWNKAIS